MKTLKKLELFSNIMCSHNRIKIYADFTLLAL